MLSPKNQILLSLIFIKNHVPEKPESHSYAAIYLVSSQGRCLDLQAQPLVGDMQKAIIDVSLSLMFSLSPPSPFSLKVYLIFF